MLQEISRSVGQSDGSQAGDNKCEWGEWFVWMEPFEVVISLNLDLLYLFKG